MAYDNKQEWPHALKRK